MSYSSVPYCCSYPLRHTHRFISPRLIFQLPCFCCYWLCHTKPVLSCQCNNGACCVVKRWFDKSFQFLEAPALHNIKCKCKKLFFFSLISGGIIAIIYIINLCIIFLLKESKRSFYGLRLLSSYLLQLLVFCKMQKVNLLMVGEYTESLVLNGYICKSRMILKLPISHYVILYLKYMSLTDIRFSLDCI
ncbi:hypothetical protein Hanom_Chr11g00989001 [Helianthus anomalus]